MSEISSNIDFEYRLSMENESAELGILQVDLLSAPVLYYGAFG